MGVYQKGKNWYIDYYLHGKRKRRKVGPSKKLAEQVLKDVQVKIVKKDFLGIAEDRKITFHDFGKRYLDYAKTIKSSTSLERDEGIIQKHLLPQFGEKYLFEITLDAGERYRAKRLTEGANPATINKETNLLKAMLNQAVRWNYLKTNPLQGMKQLKEPPGRVRYLNMQELSALLTACSRNKALLAIVQIALHTGMRRGEILALRWRNIDFPNRIIILNKTKTNERRIIPVNDTLLTVLKKLLHSEDTDKLFPDISGDKVSIAFRRACKRAGVVHFRFHDLRHTFASHLTMAGFNQRTIQHLLGHKDPRMTSRYAHLSDAYLNQAVKTLDTILVGQASGSEVPVPVV